MPSKFNTKINKEVEISRLKKIKKKTEIIEQKHEKTIKIKIMNKNGTEKHKKIGNGSYMGEKGYTIYKNQFSEGRLQQIREDLTMTPKISSDYGDVVSFPIFMENSKKMYLPRYYGIKNIGRIRDMRITKGDKINLTFAGKLRNHQVKPVKKCLQALRDEGVGNGGILATVCAFGKSCTSLYMASVLKRKTIIIIHVTVLMNQWIESIQKFLPDAKIGVIQGKRIEIEGKDIVIAMIQSISLKEYPSDFFKSFGFLIVDEVHRSPGEKYSRIFKKIKCYYRLGLSATPKRDDNLHHLFINYLGGIIHESKINSVENARVLIRRLTFIDDSEIAQEKYSKNILNFRKKPVHVKMLNNIAYYLPRTKFIVDEVIKLAKQGRQVLMLSVRIRQLEDAKQYLDSLNTNITYGFYIGSMKASERKANESKQIILASMSLCAVGMDIISLSSIAFLTPIASLPNLKQAIGRSQRKVHEMYPPLILDIIDDFSCFFNQATKRLKFYKKQGYTLVDENYEPIPVEDKKNKKSKKYNKNSQPVDSYFKLLENNGELFKDNECMFD